MPCNEMVRLLKNFDSSSEISLDESSVSDKSATQDNMTCTQVVRQKERNKKKGRSMPLGVMMRAYMGRGSPEMLL